MEGHQKTILPPHAVQGGKANLFPLGFRLQRLKLKTIAYLKEIVFRHQYSLCSQGEGSSAGTPRKVTRFGKGEGVSVFRRSQARLRWVPGRPRGVQGGPKRGSSRGFKGSQRSAPIRAHLGATDLRAVGGGRTTWVVEVEGLCLGFRVFGVFWGFGSRWA